MQTHIQKQMQVYGIERNCCQNKKKKRTENHYLLVCSNQINRNTSTRIEKKIKSNQMDLIT